MMEELPSPSLTYRLLLPEERHRNMVRLANLNTEPVVFAVDKGTYDRGSGKA